MRILKASANYFLIVFGAGFILGPLRILWLVPKVGVRVAELIEMPVMVAVTIVAARWMVARGSIPARPLPALAVGVSALLFLLVAELSVALGLRGMSISEYLAARDPISGTAYYIALGLFAMLPTLLTLKRRAKSLAQ